jgi:TPR repeat protein
VKSLAMVPLAPAALAAGGGETSSPCCQGSFRPDDLFAATSLAGDMQRARKGDLASTLRLGFGFYSGLAGVVDIARARSFFLVASHGSTAGAAWLGYLDAVRIKPGAAVRTRPSFAELVNASNAGDPLAMTLLGRVYERGLAGYKQRPDMALPLYVAAAPNFALAKACWGRILLKSGKTQQAIALFKAAASTGETTSMISLANLYSTMKRPAAKTAEMKRWLRTASLRGDRVALHLLGTHYQSGTLGLTANPKRAVALLHRSAVIGHKAAQNALAAACTAGAGVTPSATRAQFWSRKASIPSLNKPTPPPRPGRERPATAG